MGLILGVLIIQEVLDELLPGFEGTIVEYEDFDAEVSLVFTSDIFWNFGEIGIKKKTKNFRKTAIDFMMPSIRLSWIQMKLSMFLPIGVMLSERRFARSTKVRIK